MYGFILARSAREGTPLLKGDALFAPYPLSQRIIGNTSPVA